MVYLLQYQEPGDQQSFLQESGFDLILLFCKEVRSSCLLPLCLLAESQTIKTSFASSQNQWQHGIDPFSLKLPVYTMAFSVSTTQMPETRSILSFLSLVMIKGGPFYFHRDDLPKYM
uniref:Uncharacterized protein n=1 Tax=Octopus bimaculoides TaxID=37653 RepID=A0A0L8FY36_OCTBM